MPPTREEDSSYSGMKREGELPFVSMRCDMEIEEGVKFLTKDMVKDKQSKVKINLNRRDQAQKEAIMRIKTE